MKTEWEKEEWEIYQVIQLGMDRDVALKVIEREKKFKDGLWQYMVDHKRIQPNGYAGIQLYVRNRKDFFERIQARIDGDFERYKVEETDRALDRLDDIRAKLSNIRRKQLNAKISKNVFVGILAKLYEKYIQKF